MTTKVSERFGDRWPGLDPIIAEFLDYTEVFSLEDVSHAEEDRVDVNDVFSLAFLRGRINAVLVVSGHSGHSDEDRRNLHLISEGINQRWMTFCDSRAGV